MFTNPRRPVPSTAALRLLRQLAYISSGTVCGAAALIAEERRRQTHVAKKIVDNARRLKQHPRYAHSATASAPTSDTSFFTSDNCPAHSEHKDAIRGHGISGAREGYLRTADSTSVTATDTGVEAPHPIRPETDAFRDAVLPSEVDKGYRKLSRRKQHQSPTVNRHDVYAESLPAFNANRRVLDGLPFVPRVSQQVKLKKLIMAEVRTGKMENAYSRMLDYATFEQHLPSLSQAEAQRRYRQLLDLVPSDPQVWLSLPLSDHCKSLVSIFLDIYPSKSDYGTATANLVVIASRILDAALQSSSIDQIKDVLSWLLHTSQLNPDHLRKVCIQSSPSLLESDPDRAGILYTELLADSRSWKVHNSPLCTLVTIASLLEADANGSSPGVLITILRRRLGRDFQEVLFECCNTLIDSNRHASAVRLLEFSRTHKHLTARATSTRVAKDLFEHSLRRGQLIDAINMLRFFDESYALLDSKVHRLAFAIAQSGELSLLYTLHMRYNSRYPFPEELYPVICNAYAAASTEEAARFFMRTIKRPIDESVLKTVQTSWAMLLSRQWTITQNLKNVTKMFLRLCQIAGEGHVDIVLYNAMIRIYVDAKDTSAAEDLLRRMQNRDGIEPNFTTFGHFVLSAAKARDWQAVESLLCMLDSTATIYANMDRTKLFNPVLQEYVKQHEATDIWSFVAKAIGAHGVVPDQETNHIVLESLVRTKRLDLVSPWLVHMQSNGLEKAQIGAHVAMRMLRRYYYDMRPSHVVLMWLRRNLIVAAPYLKSPELTLLLRQAIAYDLRNLRNGSDQLELAVRARKRLALLEDPQALSTSVVANSTSLSAHDQPDFGFVTAAKALEDLGGNEDVDSGYASDTGRDVLPETQGHPRMDTSSDLGILERQEGVLQELHNFDEISTSHRGLSKKLKTECDILLSLSLGRPREAVDFYRRSLAASGLPYSSLSLETAILASLRAQQGDPVEAEELVSLAQTAGLNDVSGLVPLLVHRIQSSGRNDLDSLENTVLGFYRTMAENNIHVGLHVATTAAHVLIKYGKAKQAISLLERMYRPSWGHAADKASFDITAMAVFFQGYAKMSHDAGIEWTVNTVLEQDLRIDRAFLRSLRRYHRHTRLAFEATGREKLRDQALKLATLLQLCRNRQREQIDEATRFGNQLVRCIAKTSAQKPPVEVEIGTSNAPLGAPPQNQTRSEEGGNEADLGEKKSTKVHAPYTPKAAYRAVLRRGLKDAEGRRLKFRYVDGTVSN